MPVRSRVGLIEPVSDYGDGGSARKQGLLMSDGVDAGREAAYHRPICACEPTSDPLGNPSSILGGVAGPDDRNRRTRSGGFEVSAGIEDSGSARDVAESGREAGIRGADDIDPSNVALLKNTICLKLRLLPARIGRKVGLVQELKGLARADPLETGEREKAPSRWGGGHGVSVEERPMAGKTGYLVLGFGESDAHVGYCETTRPASYDVRRRIGEYRSRSVDARGVVQFAIRFDHHDAAIQARDDHNQRQLVDPAIDATLSRLVGVGSQAISDLRTVFDAALAAYHLTGRVDDRFDTIAWGIVEAADTPKAAPVPAAGPNLDHPLVPLPDNPTDWLGTRPPVARRFDPEHSRSVPRYSTSIKRFSIPPRWSPREAAKTGAAGEPGWGLFARSRCGVG